MNIQRIYADFNGVVCGPKNPDREAVVLDTFGTARDLANAGIILTEGLPLIVGDDQELEAQGTAQYDYTYKWWVVEFDEVGIRFVPANEGTPVSEFKCVGCRVDLAKYLSVPRSGG